MLEGAGRSGNLLDRHDPLRNEGQPVGVLVATRTRNVSRLKTEGGLILEIFVTQTQDDGVSSDTVATFFISHKLLNLTYLQPPAWAHLHIIIIIIITTFIISLWRDHHSRPENPLTNYLYRLFASRYTLLRNIQLITI